MDCPHDPIGLGRVRSLKSGERPRINDSQDGSEELIQWSTA